MPSRVPAPTLHTLVAGLVDYAGLFPPAALSMRDAVSAYADYLHSPDAWMLGRFVVPIARLGELAEESARHEGARAAPWRLAALAGPEVEDDMRRAREFNVAHAGRLIIDIVEAKAASPADIERVAAAVGDSATLYVEIPIADEPRALLAALHAAGARAKVRSGGVTVDAFPSAPVLARFIVRCAELGVPWKATAGLHHPLRAEHRLTYAGDAPIGTMFGFLNVFAAGVFALGGVPEATISRLLDERDPAALTFDDQVLRWQGHEAMLPRIRSARDTFAISFGSCSFREPVDDLHQLALL